MATAFGRSFLIVALIVTHALEGSESGGKAGRSIRWPRRTFAQ
jgi:hypothetical protein